MKQLTFLGALLLLLGCTQNHLAGNPPPGITLTTDKSSYHSGEPIHFKLRNNSGAGMIVGYRCGSFLEFSYQKKEQGEWQGILDFDYPLCPTTRKEIATGTALSDSLSTDMFNAKGVFRLVLGFNPKKQADVTRRIYSNEFKIE